MLTRFNAILGVLFVLVMIVGPPQDALFGVVLAVNTAIGAAQELRAKRALDKLAILTAARARVLRDGAVSEVAQDEVVLDDLLDLRRGDQVPVDAAVLHAEGLELDEALLTGEAEPVPKRPGDSVLSGSFVVAGTGRARVTAVAGQSYAVRLQAQARRFSLVRSELQQGTNQILRLVTWVMIPAGILLVISEFYRSGQPFAEAVRGSAAGVIGMVPEGLVLLTSIAFAAGVLRLARRRVLVSELAAIEGLARVDVLCTDKTGTLTKPGMRLAATEALDGLAPARIGEILGALTAADEDPNPTVRAIAAGDAEDPGGRSRRGCRSPPRASGAACRSPGTAPGCSARPGCSAAACPPRSRRPSPGTRRRDSACSCSPPRLGRWTENGSRPQGLPLERTKSVEAKSVPSRRRPPDLTQRATCRARSAAPLKQHRHLPHLRLGSYGWKDRGWNRTRLPAADRTPKVTAEARLAGRRGVGNPVLRAAMRVHGRQGGPLAPPCRRDNDGSGVPWHPGAPGSRGPSARRQARGISAVQWPNIPRIYLQSPACGQPAAEGALQLPGRPVRSAVADRGNARQSRTGTGRKPAFISDRAC